MSLREVLARLPGFSRLEAADLDALDAAFVRREVPAGQVIVRAGAHDHSAHLLLTGEVGVFGRHGDQEVELDRLGPGTLFGLVPLVDDAPRTSTCRALVPSRIASLDRGAATLLSHQTAPIALAFQRALGGELAREFRRLDARARGLVGAG